jgi:RNA polymerase sigma-70 factor (ECF subfamily)
MMAMSDKTRLTLVAEAPLAALATTPATPEEAGDEPLSLSALYERHAAYVANLAGRILGHNDETQDVVQDVFLIAHRRMEALRSPAAAKGWLAKVTVRQASRRLRWRRLRLFLQPSHMVDADLVAREGDAASRPLLALLYATLDRLPARERVAWTLRHLQGEPLDVVAEQCGCSLATAKRRIAAAEAVLRPVLDDGEGSE